MKLYNITYFIVVAVIAVIGIGGYIVVSRPDNTLPDQSLNFVPPNVTPPPNQKTATQN